MSAEQGVSFSLDLRESPRTTLGVEKILWSGLWDGDADATVQITVNGTVLAEDRDGEGVFYWREKRPGIYNLSHTTIRNGVAGETLTTAFILEEGDSGGLLEIFATPTGVPFEWLEDKGFVLPGSASATYTQAADDDVDGDGYKLWEEYIIGTDPRKSTDAGFSVEIKMRTDGKSVLTWKPDLKTDRTYIVLEGDSPSGPWTKAESGVDSSDGRVMDVGGNGYKFYKVQVKLVE